MFEKNTKLILKYKDFINSREIFFDYSKKYDKFSSSLLIHTKPLLYQFNTTFSYERKGNRREGALTHKNLKESIDGRKLYVKVIKIRKDISFELQAHTYFHELAHLVNNHNNAIYENKGMTTPLKEYVAEVVAQSLLYSFFGGLEVSQLPSNEKWDHDKYISGWIKNSRISSKREKIIWDQINYSYKLISETILGKI